VASHRRLADVTERDQPGGRAPAALRVAALLLAVEAAGLFLLGAVDLVKVATGSPRSTTYALIAAALVIATGAVLLLLARAVLQRRPWAYSPVIVLQLLALPVGFSLAVQAGQWRYGGPVLGLAVGELAALAASTVRRGVR